MFGHSMVCTVIKTLLEHCPLFLILFLFLFLFVVCFTFFKGIDGRFSGPLTALITETLVYIRILDFHSHEKAEIKMETF